MPTLLQGAAALAPNGGMLGAYSWVQCIKGWPHMCEGQLQSKLDRIVFVQPPQGCEPMGWGAPTAASAPVGAWVSMLSMRIPFNPPQGLSMPFFGFHPHALGSLEMHTFGPALLVGGGFWSLNPKQM